jgi:hypothetical protein
MRRSPAPGLSYMDTDLGRFIEEGPDVTECKARFRELDSNLNAYYDTVQEEWIVTQFVPMKNQEELLLVDKNLARAYQRTLRARNDRPGALTGDELNERLDQDQKRAQEEDLQVFRNIAHDAGERLVHAFKKDGLTDHENIYGPKPKPHLANRASSMRVFRRELGPNEDSS